MTFCLELIKTPEQAAELEALGLVSPISREPARVSRWVVDRARGLYFVHFGGGAFEMPHFLALVLRGAGTLQAQGLYHAEGQVDLRNIEVHWEIESVVLPKSMAEREEEMKQALVEALEAYGARGMPEATKSVHVKLSPARFI